jgi:hypothetical protein
MREIILLPKHILRPRDQLSIKVIMPLSPYSATLCSHTNIMFQYHIYIIHLWRIFGRGNFEINDYPDTDGYRLSTKAECHLYCRNDTEDLHFDTLYQRQYGKKTQNQCTRAQMQSLILKLFHPALPGPVYLQFYIQNRMWPPLWHTPPKARKS